MTADDSRAARCGGMPWGGMVVAGCICFCVAVLLLPAVLDDVTFHEASYNEGWNVYHAMRVARGEALYDGDLWRIVNYPYISYYLVALLARVTGEPLLVSRAVSAAGFLAVVLSCGASVRALGGSRTGAVLAGGLFAGFCAIAVRHWIGVADPQFLAQGLSAAGLAVYLGSSTRGARVAAVPVLLVAALFTKHQEVAVPAAILIDLLVRDRRDLVPWAVAMGLLGALGVAAGFLAGDAFLARVLGARGYSVYISIGTTRRMLQLVQVPLALGLLWLVGGAGIRGRGILWALLGSSGLSMVGFAGGSGVAWNVAVDFFMAVAIVAGLAADGLVGRLGLRWAGSAVLLACMGFEIELGAFLGLGQERRQWAELRRSEADFRADIAFVAGRPGDAVCESMLLCYFAGKALVLDPSNSTEMVRMGKLSGAALAAPFVARTVGVVQFALPLDGGERDGARPAERFVPEVVAAVRENYRLDHVSRSGAFYVPKE